MSVPTVIDSQALHTVAFEQSLATKAPKGAISEVALLAYPVVLQTLAETAMHEHQGHVVASSDS